MIALSTSCNLSGHQSKTKEGNKTVKTKFRDHQKQRIQKGKNPEKQYLAEVPSIFKEQVPTSSVIKNHQQNIQCN